MNLDQVAAALTQPAKVKIGILSHRNQIQGVVKEIKDRVGEDLLTKDTRTRIDAKNGSALFGISSVNGACGLRFDELYIDETVGLSLEDQIALYPCALKVSYYNGYS